MGIDKRWPEPGYGPGCPKSNTSVQERTECSHDLQCSSKGNKQDSLTFTPSVFLYEHHALFSFDFVYPILARVSLPPSLPPSKSIGLNFQANYARSDIACPNIFYLVPSKPMGNAFFNVCPIYSNPLTTKYVFLFIRFGTFPKGFVEIEHVQLEIRPKALSQYLDVQFPQIYPQWGRKSGLCFVAMKGEARVSPNTYSTCECECKHKIHQQV